MSSTVHETQTDLTLDPQDWASLRRQAHHALDAAFDYQIGVRDLPVWQPVPATTEVLLSGEAPLEGLGHGTVIDEMVQQIMPYPAGHGHPRFWGWVAGTGTPIGMVADMLAAGVNASSGVFNDAPTRVENQLIQWMVDLFGFPKSAAGIVTSGASMANVIGLAVGRDAILQTDVRRVGLSALTGTPTIYASAQVHSSVDKAMMLLGLGRDHLRKVPVNEAFQIKVDELRAMVAADRERGMLPLVVVANAGTVNTGAIDDLPALAELCREMQLWLHVDGAIGGLAVMSDNLRPLFKGIELADSIAFDFHKWLYVPYEAGCVLVRDGDQHRQSFTAAASYLEAPTRGIGAMVDTTNGRGPQLSRGFKALKVWAQIRSYGLKRLGSLHDQNVAHVQYLAGLIAESDQLELLAGVPLNILCYRYLPKTLPANATDQLNQELLMRLQEDGIAAPSGTRIHGAFALRVANTNHRSRRQDFDLLVGESLRLGRELEAGWTT